VTAPHRLALASALLLAGTGCLGRSAPRAPSAPAAFEAPAGFVVDGKPLCFAGVNSYYPVYQTRQVVDDLFDAARALDSKVVRVWGMRERGSLDGSVANADGSAAPLVYFQYWDAAQQRPAYNDGPSGLERLDYALAAAAERGLKLIVVLLNNWRAFGGVDQYLMWYGRTKHHEFFSAPETRHAYQDWVAHVIGRTNTVNGRAYRDDPSVFAWELANEPRCTGASSFDDAEGCDPNLLSKWAAEMSGYIKSLDPNHLVSVGDEGFLNDGGQHFAYRAEGGVDHGALTAISSVDFGTFHLYPEDWGMSASLAERWINDHVALARRLGKPTILEEYGLRAGEQRAGAYQRWNGALLARGTPASLAWMLAGADEQRARYPDSDHFTFYRDDATGKLLSRYAERFSKAAACRAPPGSPSKVSPFVGVTRPRARTVGSWVPADAR